MFENHEELACQECNVIFMGRRPAEGGSAFCTECWTKKKDSVVTESDEIPASVLEEHESRGGESGEN